MKERVQKILAQAGVASRRACEDLIKQGRVRINGKTVSIGANADTGKDVITVDGKRVAAQEKVYLLLHKPRGFVTTTREYHGMRTVMDLVRSNVRVYPVGRLDKSTEGLLLLTNDGELANRIMHPRYGIQKSYIAWLNKSFLHEHKLKAGIVIDGRKVEIIRHKKVQDRMVSLTVQEGRKHVVRKIFRRLGYHVVRLLRTQIGPLKLGWMGSGKVRRLNPRELRALLSAVKLRKNAAPPAQRS